MDGLKYSAKTDRGSVRGVNEDYYNIISGYPGIPASFIIADGMGGHNAGEIASRTSIDHISGIILKSPEVFAESTDMPETIRSLIVKANQAVYEKSLELTENNGMGTTLTMAVITGNMMYIGHVGDSRLYLVRKEKIKRITTDHSYIEELIKNGSLTREEAEKHPNGNIITRALGCSADLEVDTFACNLETDDCIVMCTDGLTNMTDEREIKETV
ncbi:MAG: Stp1/IreP family PP2C-type Ser/Thr phosphatase, partial [Ruminiclostridium sp.]|nr:Stp1/IreP family PP2C-type Ser/Thr phosphatase [Ruminiclostridium sp.]